MTATLSPAAVALLNLIAETGPERTNPWAKYPAVLYVEHVAEILGRSVPAVREAVRRGSIPMKKKLGRLVVDQVAFRTWIAEESS